MIFNSFFNDTSIFIYFFFSSFNMKSLSLFTLSLKVQQTKKVKDINNEL